MCIFCVTKPPITYFDLVPPGKIAKVTAVEVVDVNTTCANLTWTLPYFLRICDQCERYLYKIEYWKEEEHKFSVVSSVRFILRHYKSSTLLPYLVE